MQFNIELAGAHSVVMPSVSFRMTLTLIPRAELYVYAQNVTQ